jgi:ubiquitin-protein ligase
MIPRRTSSSSSSSSRKRDIDAEDEISEKLKRFKLSKTPGELRLRKDFIELRDYPHPGCLLELCEDASTLLITVRYVYADLLSASFTLRFLVKVSTYYPHTAPTVECLDSQGVSIFPMHIQANGLLKHPLLKAWNPVQSMRDVAHMLCHLHESATAASIEHGYDPSIVSTNETDMMDTHEPQRTQEPEYETEPSSHAIDGLEEEEDSSM